MHTDERVLSVSSSLSRGAETPPLTIPKAYTPEPSGSRYDHGLLGDFVVEWQQAASVHKPAGRS